MEWTRQHDRGGARFSLKIELDKPLTPEETVRLDHHLDIVINAFVTRYVKHVATWGEQKVALMKLDAREAKLLGLFKDWKEAQAPTSWGKRVKGDAA